MKREKKEGRRSGGKGGPFYVRRGTFFQKESQHVVCQFHVDSSSACRFRRGYILNQLCAPATIVFRELAFSPTGS